MKKRGDKGRGDDRKEKKKSEQERRTVREQEFTEKDTAKTKRRRQANKPCFLPLSAA